MSDAVNQCNLIKRLFVIRMVTELHSKRRELVMKIAKNSAVVHNQGKKAHGSNQKLLRETLRAHCQKRERVRIVLV